MPTRNASRWLILAALFTTAACSDSGNEPSGGSAPLRALHATPSLGAIDILVNGAPAVTGLAYGETSPEVQVGGGRQRILVRAGTEVLGNFEYVLDGDHLNSLVIADSVPQFSTFVEPDTGQAIGTKANIRLVNVVGTNTSAPTQLQARIQAPNANPDSVVVSNIDATVASYWSLMYFDPGQFTISYVPFGDDSVLASTSFSVAAGEKKAVLLGRAADGTYGVQVITEP